MANHGKPGRPNPGMAVYVAATAILIAVTSFIWIIGGACTYTPPGKPPRTSNYTSTVPGAAPEIKVNINRSTTQGKRTVKIQVQPGTLPNGTKVRVVWHPPMPSTITSIDPKPDMTPVGPPYVFSDLEVGGPGITATYTPGPGVGDDIADYVSVETQTGSQYFARTTDTTGGSSVAPERTGVGEGAARAPDAESSGAAPVGPAAPYSWWASELWFYDPSGETPLDTTTCQQWADFLQDGSAFVAIRFPVATVSGTEASFRIPTVHRTKANQYPRFALLDERGAYPFPELATVPLGHNPTFSTFAAKNLPAAPGEGWFALSGAPVTPVTCANGIQITGGKWEAYVYTPIDMGGTATMGENAVLQTYGCYKGSEAPFFMASAAAAAGALGVLSTVREDDITCIGPVPIRLLGDGQASPPFLITGPGVVNAMPGEPLAFHHMIELRGRSPQTITLAVASSKGLTWGLFEGNDEAPNLSRPITKPVNVSEAMYDFWVAGTVPEGTPSCGETITVTGTSSLAPTAPTWNTDLVMIGEWVPPEAPSHTVWVPVTSHASGSLQSQWRTDLGLFNPNATATGVTLRLHPTSGVLTHELELPAMTQVIHADVVSLLGFSGSAALEVVSEAPIKVSSRTYNLVASTATCYPNGTFGQDYEAFTTAQGLAAGEVAYLTRLVESADYRTNIALTNTGPTQAQATVALLDGVGAQLASYQVTLAPGEYKQEGRPFAFKAGQTNLTRGYAEVTVTQGSGVLPLASVIDNTTNDPTTVVFVRATSAVPDAWFQVASHASGANQSQWRTALGILNRTAATANVQVKLYTGGTVKSAPTTVAANNQVALADIVGQLGVTGSGALQIVSDQPVFVASRTFNLVGPTAACYPNGTFGQSYRAYASTTALAAGASAWLTQLTENPAYRTNIALTNSGSAPAVVTVTLFKGDGTQLATYTVNLNPGELKQENKPFFSKASQTNMPAGFAQITVTQGAGIIASASVVDNSTNDPTTMNMTP